MGNGPIYSNRSFKLMKNVAISEGEYIIEVWHGSNWDKETKQRSEVPGAMDIKIYIKDTSQDYDKGDFVTQLRVFENKDEGSAPSYQKAPDVDLAAEREDDAARSAKIDDDIPF